METLERDNAALQKSLEEQQFKKEAGGGKRLILGSGFSSPVASPFASKRVAPIELGGTPTPAGHTLAAPPTEDSMLLLAKVRGHKLFFVMSKKSKKFFFFYCFSSTL